MLLHLTVENTCCVRVVDLIDYALFPVPTDTRSPSLGSTLVVEHRKEAERVGTAPQNGRISYEYRCRSRPLDRTQRAGENSNRPNPLREQRKLRVGRSDLDHAGSRRG